MYAKRGKLSKEDQEKIVKWIGDKPIAEIARLLDRDPNSIRRWIDKHGAKAPVSTEYDLNKSEDGFQALFNRDLKGTSAWKQLKHEFNPKELELFQEKYTEFMTQFSKEGVLPSELMQIFHVIKSEILTNRCLKAQYRLGEEIQRIEVEQDRLAKQALERKPTKSEQDYMISLDDQVMNRRKGIQELAREYNTLQRNQADLMKTLKATRDQRVKEITDKPVDFMGLIKTLQDQEIAQREGRQMELLRLAGENAYAKLQKPHVYADKVEDFPFLIPELIKEEEDQ